MQNVTKGPPTSLPPITQEMLLKKRYDDSIPMIPILLTEEEIRGTWRITKEKKASSPSGRYNVLYKAMTMDSYLLKFLTIAKKKLHTPIKCNINRRRLASGTGKTRKNTHNNRPQNNGGSTIGVDTISQSSYQEIDKKEWI